MTAVLKGTGRLRAADDFKRVLSRGRHSRTRSLALAYLANTTGEIRLGITVSARIARSAVRRNRLRRVIRERLRAISDNLSPGYDMVITVLKDPGPGEGEKLACELDETLDECRLKLGEGP